MTSWRCDRVHVVIHDARPPTDDEWESYLAQLRERRDSHPRFFIESYGGGPDAKQRRALAEVVDKDAMRVAVLTDSIVARGILTALAWLGLPQRAFAIGAQREAIAFLELDEDEAERLLEVLPRLRAETGLRDLKRAASG